jgi:hypothetical protein
VLGQLLDLATKGCADLTRLQTGALQTGALQTGALQTGALQTGALQTEVPVPRAR